MKISHTLIFLLLVLGFGQLNAQKSKMEKIFNGKNLKGWVVPAPESCWTVSKGVLLVKSEPTKKGAILWTEKSYQNFVLQAEFLMGEGTVDSGFFLRSENDQIQIGISGSLKRDMTGSPYIPKLRYPVEATGVKELLKPKDWNSLQIKVIGNTYTAYLNGKQVMTYTSEGMAASGPIGIQLHPGNEMSISYRKILLAEL